MFDADNLDRRKTDGIWSEWTAGGKDTDATVAAQAGRTHGGVPFPAVAMEAPDEPEVGEALQAAHALQPGLVVVIVIYHLQTEVPGVSYEFSLAQLVFVEGDYVRVK